MGPGWELWDVVLDLSEWDNFFICSWCCCGDLRNGEQACKCFKVKVVLWQGCVMSLWLSDLFRGWGDEGGVFKGLGESSRYGVCWV